MLEALRFGTILAKLRARDPRVFNSRDILRLATVGGAEALGVPDHVGKPQVGYRADLVLIDPWRLKTVPIHDPVSSVVYGATQSNVDMVLVDGEIVIRDGRSTRVDETELMREAQERAERVAMRAGTAHLIEGRRLTPFGADDRG